MEFCKILWLKWIGSWILCQPVVRQTDLWYWYIKDNLQKDVQSMDNQKSDLLQVAVLVLVRISKFHVRHNVLTAC